MNDMERTLLVNDLQSRINDLQVRIDNLRNSLDKKNVCHDTYSEYGDIFRCSNCETIVITYFTDSDGVDECYALTDAEDNEVEMKYCPHCGNLII